MNRPPASRPAPDTAGESRKLSDLVPGGDPAAVAAEVVYLLEAMRMPAAVPPLQHACDRVVGLFEGRFPGYRACNTEYHDLRHTTDVFLAMARMIHGAAADGNTLPARLVVTALTAALVHDAGYIQEEHDTEGTGAKHTVRHVARSIEFLERFGDGFGLASDEIESAQLMVLCTDLAVEVGSLDFPSDTVELLAKMLGGADLVAQMADRTYLEKLLFLYREFVEAGVGGFESERDLLEKTIAFYDNFERRLRTVLDGSDRFLATHFAVRWQIPCDLYRLAIDNHKRYLKKIICRPDRDHRDFLKREGIVERIRRQQDPRPPDATSS